MKLFLWMVRTGENIYILNSWGQEDADICNHNSKNKRENVLPQMDKNRGTLEPCKHYRFDAVFCIQRTQCWQTLWPLVKQTLKWLASWVEKIVMLLYPLWQDYTFATMHSYQWYLKPLVFRTLKTLRKQVHNCISVCPIKWHIFFMRVAVLCCIQKLLHPKTAASKNCCIQKLLHQKTIFTESKMDVRQRKGPIIILHYFVIHKLLRYLSVFERAFKMTNNICSLWCSKKRMDLNLE